MSRGRRLTDAERQELRREARGLDANASIRPFCDEHAKLLGCHWSTVYRTIQADLPTSRKTRSDAGTSRSLDEQTLGDLAAIVAQYDYDAELAIDTLNANRAAAGEAEVEIHPETLRRHLRRLGVSRRENAQDLRVHRRWEAPHPGYLWQMDSTVAASWWIDTDDTVGYEAPVTLNKTKAGNGKPRIWLLGIVDDHTRVRWARFYTANSALAWRDMLIRAMRGFSPDLEKWPAFGIPERVYTDQDSAMKSAVMSQMLELLAIERLLAMPSTEQETNAQAKGKVERFLGVLLHGFEKTVRAKRVSHLSELNRLLFQHLAWLNGRRHAETGEAPFERWLKKRDVRVLPPEEVMGRVLRREVERVVAADVSIALDGKTYQLPRRAPFVDQIKKKVTVLYHEADLSKISVVIHGEEHVVEAVEALPDVAGEFKQAETPAAVELKRELLQRDLSHIDPLAVHEHRTKRADRQYVYRPETTPIVVPDRELAPVMVRRGKATDRAQRAGVIQVPPTDLERAALGRLFGDRKEIPESELDRWIADRATTRGDDRKQATGA